MGLNDIIKPKSKEEVEDLEKRGFRKDSGKWKFQIDISPLVSAFDENENTKEFRKEIINLLKSKIPDVKILKDKNEVDKLQNIINKFSSLDKNPTPDELDDVLGHLYDWADSNDIWIESF